MIYFVSNRVIYASAVALPIGIGIDQDGSSSFLDVLNRS